MKRHEIILIIGIAVVLFAAVIPFSGLDLIMANRLYFRLILIGGSTIAYVTPKLFDSEVCKSVSNALFGGFISLLFISTTNLLCNCVDSHLYYSLTFKIVVVGLLTITIYKKWIKT